MSGTSTDYAGSGMKRPRLARVTGWLLGAGFLAASSLAGAADAQEIDVQAMAWAAACISCHGGAEEVEGSRISSLAGMPADEFIGKMQDLAASTVAGALMPQLARGYDEETVARMAKYFEKLGEAQ